jgi:preprotein translocase subunit SecF
MQIKTFNFQFIPRMWFFIILSALAVAGSIFLMATKGLNFGTDFKGGVKLQYRFSGTVTEGDLRRLVDPLGVGDFSVQKIGKTEENRFVVKLEKQERPEETAVRISQAFAGVSGGAPTLEQQESVGPKAGAELRRKAQLAIIVSWLLMLIYIGYRFDFSFAPGAIVALIHDVLITLGAFALTGREVTLTIVAALLTIVGYSVNDTIVIYDRVRENLRKHDRMALREVINLSINETLSRTIITNFTVLLVVVLMFIFGEGEFQNFGFAMVIGAFAGTYSTIYIASPCYILLKEWRDRVRANAEKKAA